jgi:uncharacterized membrane protein
VSDVSAVKQVRGVAGLVGLAFGAVGAVREMREAKGKKDALALTNAVVNILAVITGAALLVRSLRRGDDA